MRVMFVYKYLTLGGVEAVLRERLDGLSAFGIEAKAWFLADGPGRASFRGLNGQTLIGDCGMLRSFLETWRPSVVSTIDTEEVFDVLQGDLWGGTLLVECHTPYPENREYLREPSARRAAAILVPSRHQERSIKGSLAPGTRINVVPNPVRRLFLEESGPTPSSSPHPIVAWAGRLDRIKNWAGFLAIAHRTHRVFPGAEFWIASTASGRQAASDLQREARQKGVLGRLQWAAGLPNEHMPRWLDQVRESGGVFVSTSRAESFGMAVAEAMARGCSVVVPRIGPFEEYIAHGETGMMYRPGDYSGAADTIVKLITNDGQRRAIGLAARASILATHSPAVALKSLAATLFELVSEPAPAREPAVMGAGEW